MRVATVFLSFGLLSGCQYRAPVPPPVPNSGAVDPPGRVARLSYLRGPVSFQGGGN